MNVVIFTFVWSLVVLMLCFFQRIYWHDRCYIIRHRKDSNEYRKCQSHGKKFTMLCYLNVFISTIMFSIMLNVLPTHEELFTIASSYKIKSYRDMPYTLYQFQNKFRDEPRPRFGLIRVREFIMKDAYSFDKDLDGLDVSYNKMYEANEQSASNMLYGMLAMSYKDDGDIEKAQYYADKINT